MDRDWQRWWRHAFWTRGKLRRAFPVQVLDAIEKAIGIAETTHSGEIRFAVEGALEPADVWLGKTPRARALEVFASLGVWDTEANNGVLIYLLLADRDVEIVADRGLNGRVAADEWTAVCATMEESLRSGHYERGAVAAVQAVGALLARHYPPTPAGRDELPNRPAVL
ncbi:MAG TPA: TPM domain-containing protein [Steroidobacteraceae bacterium]